jgi:hypothetical protein
MMDRQWIPVWHEWAEHRELQVLDLQKRAIELEKGGAYAD